jgi:hypothetical protein
MEAEAEIRDLQDELQSGAGIDKASIVREIREWQARLKATQQEGVSLGCKLN